MHHLVCSSTGQYVLGPTYLHVYESISLCRTGSMIVYSNTFRYAIMKYQLYQRTTLMGSLHTMSTLTNQAADGSNLILVLCG
jgi:hypothetical protein